MSSTVARALKVSTMHTGARQPSPRHRKLVPSQALPSFSLPRTTCTAWPSSSWTAACVFCRLSGRSPSCKRVGTGLYARAAYEGPPGLYEMGYSAVSYPCPDCPTCLTTSCMFLAWQGNCRTQENMDCPRSAQLREIGGNCILLNPTLTPLTLVPSRMHWSKSDSTA